MSKDTRTDEEIDDAIERWHAGAGMGQQLHEYLGWTWEEYGHWVQTNEKP